MLITGMSGLIGAASAKELGKTHAITALNRRPVEGVPTTQADITDLDAIRSAFDGQETVVHLAAKAGEGTWQELRDARRKQLEEQQRRAKGKESGKPERGDESDPARSDSGSVKFNLGNKLPHFTINTKMDMFDPSRRRNHRAIGCESLGIG